MRAARGSGYEGRPLVEEFKRGINTTICRDSWSQNGSQVQLSSSMIGQSP